LNQSLVRVSVVADGSTCLESVVSRERLWDTLVQFQEYVESMQQLGSECVFSIKLDYKPEMKGAMSPFAQALSQRRSAALRQVWQNMKEVQVLN